MHVDRGSKRVDRGFQYANRGSIPSMWITVWIVVLSVYHGSKRVNCGSKRENQGFKRVDGGSKRVDHSSKCVNCGSKRPNHDFKRVGRGSKRTDHGSERVDRGFKHRPTVDFSFLCGGAFIAPADKGLLWTFGILFLGLGAVLFVLRLFNELVNAVWRIKRTETRRKNALLAVPKKGHNRLV